jgi:hypothetical protein
MNQDGNILGVLSGKESVKVDVGIQTKAIIIIAVSVFIAVLGAVIIAHKIS